MDDESIIQLYLERNEQAIAESEKKFGGYCGNIANNILSDPRDCEEALNETWLRAWKRIPPEIPRTLVSFLGGITRNISLNIIRKDKAQKRSVAYAESYDELEEIVGDGDVEEELYAKELEKAIDAFLNELPEMQLKVFICRYRDFCTIEEIAEKYGFSKGKVKSILFRIRKNLKTQLDKEEIL